MQELRLTETMVMEARWAAGWPAGVGVGLLLVWYLEEKTTGFVSARV